MTLRDQVDAEIQLAESARQEGLEGKARVCARRAAGLAAHDYLLRQDPGNRSGKGKSIESWSVYDSLKALTELSDLSGETRQAARNLILPVDEEFNLPEGTDLIVDARLVIKMCMDEKPEITLYGTNWCGRSRRCLYLLDQAGIPYIYVDIDQDEQAALLVERLNNGFRSVPTLVWTDGSHLTEPSDVQLLSKLGINAL
jgi:mycoredoxin